jgi:hypothetical protein
MEPDRRRTEIQPTFGWQVNIDRPILLKASDFQTPAHAIVRLLSPSVLKPNFGTAKDKTPASVRDGGFR